MLGVVMLAAAVPTLPAVSYYLPPRKNTLAPVGQPPVAMVLVSPVKNRCVTAHSHRSVVVLAYKNKHVFHLQCGHTSVFGLISVIFIAVV